MERVWHRHRSVTLWRHDMPSAAKMVPVLRTRYWRYRFAHVPWVWWEVSGRKWLDKQHSLAVRRMWGLGKYGLTR